MKINKFIFKKRSKGRNWRVQSKTVTADNMIRYIENPKDTTKKLLEHISEFGKVARYKINIEECVALLYANVELSEREIKSKNPIYTFKKNKIPRNKSLFLNLDRFFFFFGHTMWFVGSQFPNQGLNPGCSSESQES